jgi:hypothetical protein
VNPAAVLIPLAVAEAGAVVFCLADLVRAEQVRHLPRWAWAWVIICLNVAGVIIYLTAGRVRTEHEYERGYRAAQSTLSTAAGIILPALGDQAGREFDLCRWAGSQKAALRQRAAGPGPFELPAWFAPLADDLGSLLDPVGYDRWSFTPATPFLRGYQAALRDAQKDSRPLHGAAANGPG